MWLHPKEYMTSVDRVMKGSGLLGEWWVQAGDLAGLVGRTLKITQERSIFTLLEMARP